MNRILKRYSVGGLSVLTRPLVLRHRRELGRLRTGIGITCVVALFALCQVVSRVEVQQIVVTDPIIKIYMDVLQSDGSVFPGLSTPDFKAFFSGRWIPFESVQTFENSHEGITYVMLVDISKSVSRVSFKEVQAALKIFIEKMSAEDKMALIPFGDSVPSLREFTSNKPALIAKLMGLKPTDSRTALYEALITAMHSTDGTSKLPSRRVIVILTDGKDDDDIHGKDQRDVERAIDEMRIPIYAIGITPEPQRTTADASLRTLATFAAKSTGLYRPLGRAAIGQTYEEIRTAIRRVYVGKFRCDDCARDGQPHTFKVSARKIESSGSNLILFPSDSDDEARHTSVWLWAIGIGLALLLLAGIASLVLRNRRKREEVPGTVSGPGIVEPPKPRWRITFVVVTGRGEHLPPVSLVDRVVIGRDSSCKVCLPGDERISKQHCEIYEANERLFVKDLNSRTGTILGNTHVKTPMPIDDGDELRIGDKRLRIRVERLR